MTTEVVGMVQVLKPLHLVRADYRDQSAIAQWNDIDCMERFIATIIASLTYEAVTSGNYCNLELSFSTKLEVQYVQYTDR